SEPNLKKSRGGLRDAHLIRWIAAVRWGARHPGDLVALGVLSAEDVRRLEAAVEFLLWLRNELHFAAGKPGDVLSRADQVRIAETCGCAPAEGMLPVEQFMREYFRHTGEVSHLAAWLLAKARAAPRWTKFWTSLFGRRVPGGLLAGPTEILATRPALRRLRGNLAAIMHLVELASLYDKQIAVQTWEAIRREVPSLATEIPPEACRHFTALLEHPGRLGELLRRLHEVGLLERFIPEFSHARGLLQFNQYHKYTVDEHCLRAVERAVDLVADSGPLGRVYRAIAQKRVLHLALLIHDLGKGYPEDHSEVGRRIARDTARRLGLDDEEADHLEFLVSKHLLMNHVALRRDTSDEQTIVRFAAEVGSPERLQTLFVFTAADLGAVGPDTWTGWKAEVLADLFHRAMQHLAGESPGTSRQEYLEGRRQAVRDLLGPDQLPPKLAVQIEALPAAYLTTTDPAQIADDLRLLAALAPGEVKAQGRYQRDSGTVQFTVGTSEDVTPGIFHKLTGALSGHGLEILSAQIYTLAEGMVLDRFWVYDPDYSGEPPPHRLEEIQRSLVESLLTEGKRPRFRRVWQPGATQQPAAATAPTRVHIDNHTSDRYTIIDVVTFDRRGLLYAITRTLFELGYSVWRAKIGTYLDQVVDVFYVTDQSGAKVESAHHLQETRRRLLEVIEQPDE
ncbi:MAG: HD domain-containing protein, partial [Thermoguttaceae bacterium]|nr:HD domain-containing protein [Thermoguttaceae bacterium]